MWHKKKNYKDEQIFNADETSLFFKLTPQTTLKFKGEKCSCCKIPQERITVLVAANISGTKKNKIVCNRQIKESPLLQEC